MNEELLYNDIYEKTKECGRTQFIRLLMDKGREIKQLKENYECIKRQRDDISKNATEQLENSINEIKQQKEQLEASEKARKEAIEYILKHKRNLIHAITREEYEILDDENIVDLLNILDIDKGE